MTMLFSSFFQLFQNSTVNETALQQRSLIKEKSTKDVFQTGRILKFNLATTVIFHLDILTHISLVSQMVSRFWKWAMSADPDQTLHNAASDQGLHCLHIKFLLKVIP